MRRSARRHEPWRNVATRLLSAEVQKRPGVILSQDQPQQRLGISMGGTGIKARCLRNRRRAIPNTNRAQRKHTSRLAQMHRRFDARLGSQDQATIVDIRPFGRQQKRCHQRACNGLHRVTKSLRKISRKALALHRGTCQQDGDGAGLRGHAKGVTPVRTQRAMNMATLTFLGIESSCDDSAAAVVRQVGTNTPEILSSIVEGQTSLHASFGGVVPEIAARAHAEKLDGCVERALSEAGLTLAQIDGIAVTSGPGLIGGVLSGVMLAKGIATGSGKPIIGVNHLAGHALTPRLTDGLAFPYLMLLVSGGHCQFLIVHSPQRFRRLGGTIDDAPGEAFDKTAKLLGLPQPGGPAVETEAALGNPTRFPFPRPLLDRPGCDLSFSGLKTALLRARDAIIVEKQGITRQDRQDLCAGFQSAVTDVLVEKTRRALVEYLGEVPEQPAFAIAGGVAANKPIRAALETLCSSLGVRFFAPPLRLCTDNAAMIAWAGIEISRTSAPTPETLVARPRWPLDASAAPMIGSGKKGAKA